MKVKWMTLILATIGFTVACGDYGTTSVDSNPVWVEQVLSTSPNDADLEGDWAFSSVQTYETGDCTGDATSHDYSGSVTYGETLATRTDSKTLSETEFLAIGFSSGEFAQMCADKGGELNSDNSCTFIFDTPFKYYLGEKGYCEMYDKKSKNKDKKAKSGKAKKKKDGKENYWCGTLQMDGNIATITYSFVSDYPGKSFCKVVELTRE